MRKSEEYSTDYDDYERVISGIDGRDSKSSGG
jgi:hypothetical protein